MYPKQVVSKKELRPVCICENGIIWERVICDQSADFDSVSPPAGRAFRGSFHQIKRGPAREPVPVHAR
jgi:hypothetical protein